jgi:hypothetical protein
MDKRVGRFSVLMCGQYVRSTVQMKFGANSVMLRLPGQITKSVVSLLLLLLLSNAKRKLLKGTSLIVTARYSLLRNEEAISLERGRKPSVGSRDAMRNLGAMYVPVKMREELGGSKELCWRSQSERTTPP